MEHIAKMLEKLQLTEEDTAIDIEDEALEEVTKKGDLCLIGKVWVDRSIGRGIIEAVMTKIW